MPKSKTTGAVITRSKFGRTGRGGRLYEVLYECKEGKRSGQGPDVEIIGVFDPERGEYVEQDALEAGPEALTSHALTHTMSKAWERQGARRHMLRFQAEEVRGLAEHARNAPDRIPSTSEVFAPGCYEYLAEGVEEEDVVARGGHLPQARIDQLDTRLIAPSLLLLRDHSGLYSAGRAREGCKTCRFIGGIHGPPRCERTCSYTRSRNLLLLPTSK